MNKQEYARYEERVEFYLNGLEFVSTGPCNTCDKCPEAESQYDYTDADREPWFSWHPCEICNRPEGGNREYWHGILTTKIPFFMFGKGAALHTIKESIVHGTCCEDCVYYLAYGRLDDSTMMKVEEES